MNRAGTKTSCFKQGHPCQHIGLIYRLIEVIVYSNQCYNDAFTWSTVTLCVDIKGEWSTNN